MRTHTCDSQLRQPAQHETEVSEERKPWNHLLLCPKKLGDKRRAEIPPKTDVDLQNAMEMWSVNVQESEMDDRTCATFDIIFHFTVRTLGEQRSIAKMVRTAFFLLHTIAFATPPLTNAFLNPFYGTFRRRNCPIGFFSE